MANKILKLAALAGLGYAGFNALSSSDKAAATKALGFTSVPQNETDFVALIKSTIKSDKELQRLLTGPTGSVGPTGATGANGLKGLDGDFVVNFGNSLIKNGSLELLTTEGWDSFEQIQGYNGLRGLSKTGSYLSNNTKFIRDPDNLYKISLYAKGGGSLFCAFQDYDLNKTLINRSNGGFAIYNKPIPTQWSKFVGFIGGIGTLQTNFWPNSIYSSISFTNASATIPIEISSLVVEKVSLGEPVPHNLPFIPVNQTLINSVTGKVGIFNGTTVDYYF